MREAPIFRDLPAELQASLATRFVARSFRRGDVLFTEGSPVQGVHLVALGRIKLIHETSTGRAVILRVHGACELLDLVHASHPSTAVALDAGVVLVLPRADFVAASAHPAMAHSLVAELTRRLGQAEERIRDLQTEPVEPRLARAVLRLARPTVALTRQDLADLTGTTLHTASRVLAAWHRRGLVEARRERVTVLDPHALAVIGGS